MGKQFMNKCHYTSNFDPVAGAFGGPQLYAGFPCSLAFFVLDKILILLKAFDVKVPGDDYVRVVSRENSDWSFGLGDRCACRCGRPEPPFGCGCTQDMAVIYGPDRFPEHYKAFAWMIMTHRTAAEKCSCSDDDCDCWSSMDDLHPCDDPLIEFKKILATRLRDAEARVKDAEAIGDLHLRLALNRSVKCASILNEIELTESSYASHGFSLVPEVADASDVSDDD